MMLICFGLSWPFNIVDSLCGMAGKFIGGNVIYVVMVYFLDILMVTADLILAFRSRRLDKLSMQADQTPTA